MQLAIDAQPPRRLVECIQALIIGSANAVNHMDRIFPAGMHGWKIYVVACLYLLAKHWQDACLNLIASQLHSVLYFYFTQAMRSLN